MAGRATAKMGDTPTNKHTVLCGGMGVLVPDGLSNVLALSVAADYGLWRDA